MTYYVQNLDTRYKLQISNLQKNINVSIVEQLNRQNNLDYYTKQKIDIEDMSLDRLDSSKGYIPGNIVITHKIINIMKNDLSINEFKTYITNLYNIDSF